MTEGKQEKQPANVYDILDRLAAQQEQQAKQLELLAQAVAALSDRVPKGGQPQQGGGLGDLIKVLKEASGEEKKGVNVTELAKAARAWALIADAVGHYRNPVLPYSGADRFLMKAGARHVYKTIYEGVKTRTGEPAEQPTEEELDKMLGFKTEAEEEKKEKKEGHAI